MNEKEGKSFDVAKSIMAQLPFFSCKNIVLDDKSQKDIAKYIYCNDFNVQPYKGSYGEQPKIWIEKSFIISELKAEKKPKRCEVLYIGT